MRGNFPLTYTVAHHPKVNFECISSALSASQVEESYSHDGLGIPPSLKDTNGRWDTRGHLERIVFIDASALSTIALLSEGDDSDLYSSRFIHPYTQNTLSVFSALAEAQKMDIALGIESGISSQPDAKSSVGNEWQQQPVWNETGAQKAGIITRKTEFRPLSSSIIQGPMIYCANPLYKTPKRVSNTHKAFDPIDLVQISDEYRPRTNFGPAVDFREYMKHSTSCQWDNTKRHVDFFRLAVRCMVALNSERSLVSAIIPPGVAHVHAVESLAFRDEKNLLRAQSLMASLAADFFVKASGTQSMFSSNTARFPFPFLCGTALSRGLRLNCLTSAYMDLWNSHAPTLAVLPWSSTDRRLHLEGPVEGPATWDRTAGLRTELARRMALVEIDVLVGQALGLTLDQLIEIYRIYFPVLQENEADTWYDQNGRIVWTCSKGLPNVGWLDERGKSPGRAAWEKILADNPTELTCTAIDDTQPGGPREVTRHFVGPFTRCNRIEDYKQAWAHFERLKTEESL